MRKLSVAEIFQEPSSGGLVRARGRRIMVWFSRTRCGARLLLQKGPDEHNGNHDRGQFDGWFGCLHPAGRSHADSCETEDLYGRPVGRRALGRCGCIVSAGGSIFWQHLRCGYCAARRLRCGLLPVRAGKYHIKPRRARVRLLLRLRPSVRGRGAAKRADERVDGRWAWWVGEPRG